MAADKKVLDFDDNRFARVTRSVIEDEKYLKRPVDKLVYTVLCMYANNKTLSAHPSIKTLVDKCLCSENSVRTSLKRLEELELVSIKRRKKGKENFSNEYTLWVPPSWFTDSTSNKEGYPFKS